MDHKFIKFLEKFFTIIGDNFFLKKTYVLLHQFFES